MTIEERIEAAQKLIEEVKAELAAKAAPRRNWPEKVEAGMVFRAYGSVIIATASSTDLSMVSAVSIAGKTHGTTCYKWNNAPDLEYLGHARDRIKIIEDAHEPTYRCTVCGRIGSVGRCCGDDTRIPVKLDLEPTGAELVGDLQHIYEVSTNPGRTLTTLGLTECLESCHRIAADALRKIKGSR